MGSIETSPRPTFQEALAVWAKIGVLSFGGPAGQIALMHRVLVDERRWIAEDRFLHALELLHAAAGARGHAACHLCRLAAARHARRACRRTSLRAAGRLRRPRLEHLVCLFRPSPDRRGGVHRHQGRGPGDRHRGPAACRAACAARCIRCGHRRIGLYCHLLLRRPFPTRYRGGRTGGLCGAFRQAGATTGSAARCRRAARRRRSRPRLCGLPSGSCRSSW